ncbi:MAG: hypothetical protein OEL19_10315 [Sulfurimonas sp.]|nr:hypothetical protein [Sulfurimonas sp.]
MKITPNEMKFYTLEPKRLYGLLECGCTLCNKSNKVLEHRDLGYCR